jgi:hypothetical protein
MCPRYVLQLLFGENHKFVNCLGTRVAREKISTDLEFRILEKNYACLTKFTFNQMFHNKISH